MLRNYAGFLKRGEVNTKHRNVLTLRRLVLLAVTVRNAEVRSSILLSSTTLFRVLIFRSAHI